MNSSPIDEVSIQVNPDPPVALSGEASQISSRATTRIEHPGGGHEDRCEGGEGTGDRRRTECGKGIWVVGVRGDAVGDDIAGDLALNLTSVHSLEFRRRISPQWRAPQFAGTVGQYGPNGLAPFAR